MHEYSDCELYICKSKITEIIQYHESISVKRATRQQDFDQLCVRLLVLDERTRMIIGKSYDSMSGRRVHVTVVWMRRLNATEEGCGWSDDYMKGGVDATTIRIIIDEGYMDNDMEDEGYGGDDMEDEGYMRRRRKGERWGGV